MWTISERDIKHIKGATEASYELGGGVTNFADLIGVGVSTLSNYASLGPDNAKKVIRVDIAIEADRRAGTPVIITEAARQLGYDLVPTGTASVPVTDAVAADDGLSLVDLLSISIKAGQLANTAIAAKADGRVDALERDQIEQAFLDAMRTIERAYRQFRGV
ncbi:phage regulatory CII family protein [Agrobacterium vitis]